MYVSLFAFHFIAFSLIYITIVSAYCNSLFRNFDLITHIIRSSRVKCTRIRKQKNRDSACKIKRFILLYFRSHGKRMYVRRLSRYFRDPAWQIHSQILPGLRIFPLPHNDVAAQWDRPAFLTEMVSDCGDVSVLWRGTFLDYDRMKKLINEQHAFVTKNGNNESDGRRNNGGQRYVVTSNESTYCDRYPKFRYTFRFYRIIATISLEWWNEITL